MNYYAILDEFMYFASVMHEPQISANYDSSPVQFAFSLGPVGPSSPRTSLGKPLTTFSSEDLNFPGNIFSIS